MVGWHFCWAGGEAEMEVKEAVKLAKDYVSRLFDEEQIKNLGLEEVEFEDHSNIWRITVGFSRPWDGPANPLSFIAGGLSPLGRSYKTVRLSDVDGKVLSVISRDVPTPAS
jgi:hypothetical protein